MVSEGRPMADSSDRASRLLCELGFFCLLTAVLLGLPGLAEATTGSGCLTVVNLASGDFLNMRSQPSVSSRIVDTLQPHRHGILHLDSRFEPSSVTWGNRWCPVTHYDGDQTIHGWVKARYVRDSECP